MWLSAECSTFWTPSVLGRSAGLTTTRESGNKSAFLKYVRRGTGLPDVVGAIDGCHARIARPTDSEQSYYNRKKFHSIILQGVCDTDMMFTSIFIGIPGRAHDSRVLHDNFFYEEAAAKCEGGYLVEDAAYPLKMWLLSSYRHTTAKWEP
ncbi:hypothetical protein HPB51_003389 [Rhipicephalus microplus]|uniref:DDE Tnp4 domain-containing protein n=1 Tax=Rhipicephalus microplus TaxID=6941 RepID=A0A9J6D3F5_RHIMP|nr:hypothetical protein HPB51_003389 [Rhipicephalus microplus]